MESGLQRLDDGSDEYSFEMLRSMAKVPKTLTAP